MAMAPMKVFGGLLFALCVFVPLISASSAEFKSCNTKENYVVKVTGLDINPYPIKKNKDTTFEIAATTAEQISGGKLVIDVAYFGIHIHTEDHDLCQKTSCPIPVGDFLVSHSQTLPGYTPPGSYSLTMTMVDGNNKQLTCINFDFSIGWFAEENLADM